MYEVVSSLGAGGMGEVYRAKDSRLKREVAIKVLPPELASDRERMARFQREAEVLASLNHPHIAHIYGLEENALVMELVEGEDLSQRIARGAMSFDDAMAIARQIVDALECAHEQAIVHRDLKPANIKVRDDGTVKVLDFGLAKASDPRDPGPEAKSVLANSPTITSPGVTQAGIILGTAAYMSPEQARGKHVDKRTDVWAFGCVLYEMLTGTRVFDGEDATEIISAVVRAEPDWTALPPSVPPHVRLILARCLAKDRKARIPDLAVVRYAIDGSLATAPASATVVAAAPWWRRGALSAASVLVGVAVAALVFTQAGWRRVPQPTVSRLTMDGPGEFHEIAISPDGSRALMRLDNTLSIRSMSAFDVVPLKVTASGIRNAVFSPDGQSISLTAGTVLKRMTTAGGATVDLATLPDEAIGCQWTGEYIYCAVGAKGIVRVAAAGGAVEQVVSLQPGEFAATPALVPGSSTLLYTVAPSHMGSRGDWEHGSVVSESLTSHVRTVIAAHGSDPHYLPTGQVAYINEGVWLAVAVDATAAHAIGAPTALLTGVGRWVGVGGLLQPMAKIDLSQTGTLVYARGPASLAAGWQVIAADRSGQERVLAIEPKAYEAPRISPDGRQLAISTNTAQEAAVWIYDLSGARAARRLTFAGRNRLPVWSPDSRRVAFQSDRGGDTAIFVQVADGSSDAERWTTAAAGTVHVPESWSRDGRFLAFSSVSENGADLWLRSLATGEAARFGDVHSNAPLNASFSPDGRWLAYTLRSKTATVFAQPVPATGAKYQLSDDDAHHPFWSPDGTELFFWGRGGGTLSATSIAAGGPMAFGPAHVVPGNHRSNMTALGPRNYDITPDGKQFVLARMMAEDDAERPGTIAVVLNWLSELKGSVKP